MEGLGTRDWAGVAGGGAGSDQVLSVSHAAESAPSPEN